MNICIHKLKNFCVSVFINSILRVSRYLLPQQQTMYYCFQTRCPTHVHVCSIWQIFIKVFRCPQGISWDCIRKWRFTRPLRENLVMEQSPNAMIVIKTICCNLTCKQVGMPITTVKKTLISKSKIVQTNMLKYHTRRYSLADVSNDIKSDLFRWRLFVLCITIHIVCILNMHVVSGFSWNKWILKSDGWHAITLFAYGICIYTTGGTDTLF